MFTKEEREKLRSQAMEQIRTEISPNHGMPEPHKQALKDVDSAMDTAVALARVYFGEFSDPQPSHVIEITKLLLERAEYLECTAIVPSNDNSK